jgi:hypothetical protein
MIAGHPEIRTQCRNVPYVVKAALRTNKGGTIPTEAALLVLYDAINLRFSLFYCHRSTYRSHTGSILAFAKLDFPSPTNAVSQLNHGVFYSFIFHKMLSARQPSGGIRQTDGAVCPLVYLRI